MLATAKAVVENEGTSTSGRNADPKAARCLRALDCDPCEIRDAVACAGTGSRLIVSSLSFLRIRRRVRTVSALSVDAVVGECAFNVPRCHRKCLI